MYTFGEKDRDDVFRHGFRDRDAAVAASDPGIAGLHGVGAFQMIRRSAYEAMGTHRRLAMEVVDDMKLGKLVKEADSRSGVAKAGSAVSVHWHAGVGNIDPRDDQEFFRDHGIQVVADAAAHCSGCY